MELLINGKNMNEIIVGYDEDGNEITINIATV